MRDCSRQEGNVQFGLLALRDDPRGSDCFISGLQNSAGMIEEDAAGISQPH